MNNLTGLKGRKVAVCNNDGTYDGHATITQCTCGSERFIVERGWVLALFVFCCADCGKRYGWSE